MATQIESHFQFHPDWHRRGAVRDLVGSYYAQMRSLLRERPDLRPCLKRCRHCRIFFFTHPRNAGRDDLSGHSGDILTCNLCVASLPGLRQAVADHSAFASEPGERVVSCLSRLENDASLTKQTRELARMLHVELLP